MQQFLDKYRVIIGIFLVLIILAGGLILIYKKKNYSNNITSNNEQELQQKISELETRIQALEQSKTQVAGQKSDSTDSNQSNNQSDKININTADATTLEKLPGIGATRAQAIIDYRIKNGPFKNPADIQKISGIGPATYEKMKDMITVGQ